MMSAEEEQLGTTRGGQPMQPGPWGAGRGAAEVADEQALGAGREQIGTTRGGQPIESLTHPSGSAEPADPDEIGETRGDQPIDE